MAESNSLTPWIGGAPASSFGQHPSSEERRLQQQSALMNAVIQEGARRGAVIPRAIIAMYVHATDALSQGSTAMYAIADQTTDERARRVVDAWIKGAEPVMLGNVSAAVQESANFLQSLAPVQLDTTKPSFWKSMLGG